MKEQSRAGQARREARKLEVGRLEIEVSGDVLISDEHLTTLAEIATDHFSDAMVQMPLAAVSVICHALSYIRNSPALDGVLKLEADKAYDVMTYICEDMHPGAQAAFDAVDAEFARQAAAKGGVQ